MKKKILIVEDEIIIVRELENILQDIGYDVCAFACNVDDAIQKANDCRPDLVLMDIQLRGEESGIQAAEKIKKLYDIPFVYVTAFADQQLLDRAKISEPFGYILKPVEPRTLKVAIEIALYKHQAEKDKAELQARLYQAEKREALRKSEERFRTFMDNSRTIAWAKDEAGRYVYLNKTYEQLLKDHREGWYGKMDEELWIQEVAEKFRKNDSVVLTGGQPVEFIEKIVNPDGEYCSWWIVKFPFSDELGGRYVGGIAIDNTARMQAEEELRKALNDLEMKRKKLEEMNTALKVILDQRERDKVEFQESILVNFKNLILPCLENLRQTPLSQEQLRHVDMLASLIRNIVSPFVQKLSHTYLSLTPTEIRVAEMIREGMQTKEIAAFLNLSPTTVRSYRENIRHKLGLQGKKTNLRSFLQTME